MAYSVIPVDGDTKPGFAEWNEIREAILERHGELSDTYSVFESADPAVLGCFDEITSGRVNHVSTVRSAITDLMFACRWYDESTLKLYRYPAGVDEIDPFSKLGISPAWPLDTNTPLVHIKVPNDAARMVDLMRILRSEFHTPGASSDTLVNNVSAWDSTFESLRAAAFGGLSTPGLETLAPPMMFGRSGFAYQISDPPHMLYEVEASCIKTITATWPGWPVSRLYERVIIRIVEHADVNSPTFTPLLKIGSTTVGSFNAGIGGAVHDIEIDPELFQFAGGTASITLEFQNETADPTAWSGPPTGWDGMPLGSDWHQGWMHGEDPTVYVFVKPAFDYVLA